MSSTGTAGDLTAGAGAPAGSPRWIVAGLVSLVVLAASYLGAVWTSRGQAFGNAALRGADQATGVRTARASAALAGITVYSLAATVAAVALVALLRRRTASHPRPTRAAPEGN